MSVVNVHDAKTHLSELLARAESGEEIIIARAGVPVARLVPVEARPPRRPGLVRGQLTPAFFEPLPDSDLAAWELGLEEKRD